MKAIVIGGTGATGTALVDQLLEDQEITSVVSLVRNAERKEHAKLQEIEIDFDTMQSYSAHIKGDIAFSTLGTTVKAAGSTDAQWKVDFEYNLEYAKIAKENGVPTFVLLSALGANAKGLFFYSKMKGRLEDEVKELNFDHLVLTRPSILIRPDSERTGEKLGVKAMQAITSLGLFENYQALHVNQVARAMIQAGKTTNKTLLEIEVEEIKSYNN